MKQPDRTNPPTTSRIRIDPPRQEGASVRLEGELSLVSGQTRRIYFEFSAPNSRPYPAQTRPFLLAFLPPAMGVGAPLELEFPLDAVTLSNLMEWQEAMASWNPQMLKVVPIRAPLAAPSETPSESGALTAFSGGVDSNFTARRHTRDSQTSAFRKTRLRAGLMVHGFDIPLDREREFARAWSRSQEMLETFGLEAYRLATNLRSLDKLPGCNWERTTHGIWLAAALSCYEPWFGQILIPSTYAYPKLLLPWASNPITDPLFSSATTTYWHDGAAYTKLTKMQAIAAEPVVQRHLRVCWQQEGLDRNCGRCFKCVATQVCFWLCGVERPEAFPNPCSMANVACVEVKNEQNDWLLRSILYEARCQRRHQMVSALNRALMRGKIARWFQKIKQALRLSNRK